MTTTAALTLRVDNFSKGFGAWPLEKKLLSQPHFAAGFLWRLMARWNRAGVFSDASKMLELCVVCGGDAENPAWKCSTKFTLCAKAQLDGCADETRKFEKFIEFNASSLAWRVNEFISYEDVIDPFRGLLVGDTLILTAKLEINISNSQILTPKVARLKNCRSELFSTVSEKEEAVVDTNADDRCEHSAVVCASRAVEGEKSVAEQIEARNNCELSPLRQRCKTQSENLMLERLKVSQEKQEYFEDFRRRIYNIEKLIARSTETRAELANAKLAKMSKKLAKTQTKLTENGAKLAEKSAKLEETNARLEETSVKLAETSAKLAEKEAAVNLLNHAELNKELEKRQIEISRKNEIIINEITADLDRLRMKISACENSMNKMRHANSAMVARQNLPRDKICRAKKHPLKNEVIKRETLADEHTSARLAFGGAQVAALAKNDARQICSNAEVDVNAIIEIPEQRDALKNVNSPPPPRYDAQLVAELCGRFLC